MKRSIHLAILISSLSMSLSQFASAQENFAPKSEIGKEYVKKKREERISRILGTMTTFGIEAKVMNMKINGVNEQQFYSLLSSSGQLHDLVETDIDLTDGDFSLEGTAIIPYKIKISPEGLTFLEVSVAKLYIFESVDSDIAKLEVDFLMFEYNNKYDYLTNKELTLSIVRGFYEASLDGLGVGAGVRLDVPVYANQVPASSHQTVNFGAGTGYRFDIKGKAAFGLNQNEDLILSIGTSAYIRHNKYRHYLSPEGKAKMEIDDQAYHSAFNEDKAAIEQWDNDKFAWEVANGYPNSVSHEFYLASTNSGARPSFRNVPYAYKEKYEQNVVRNTIVVSPSISLKKDFYSKSGKLKHSLELSLEADLFLLDKFKGKKEAPNRRFQKQNRNTGSSLSNEELVDFKTTGPGLSQNNFNLRLVYKFGARE